MRTVTKELSIGDLVELGIGGPLMRIVAIEPGETNRQIICTWLSRAGEPITAPWPEPCVHLPDPLLKLDRQPKAPVHLGESVQATLAQIALESDPWNPDRVATIQHFLCQSVGAVLQLLPDKAHALITEPVQLELLEKTNASYWWRWREFIMDFEDQIVDFLLRLGWTLTPPQSDA